MMTTIKACNAAADSDGTMDSPDLVRSHDGTNYIDGARGKFLRGHKDCETEEIEDLGESSKHITRIHHMYGEPRAFNNTTAGTCFA
ncbi:hypothetical protein L914_13778, partial [Phytophthora nicotianae]